MTATRKKPSNRLSSAPNAQAAGAKTRSRPRVVYMDAPALLGVIESRDEDSWRVRLGRTIRTMRADAAVDPALLELALETGARVLVDANAEPLIVGVLLTSRPVTMDREGRVEANVSSFRVHAEKEVTLQTDGAFVQVKETQVELYASRVLTRASEVAKILARMISLN